MSPPTFELPPKHFFSAPTVPARLHSPLATSQPFRPRIGSVGLWGVWTSGGGGGEVLEESGFWGRRQWEEGKESGEVGGD